jgi:hypothetical protein
MKRDRRHGTAAVPRPAGMPMENGRMIAAARRFDGFAPQIGN